MTICALSSASGQSGVAVLRISGPETKKLVEMITRSPLPTPRMANLSKLYNINTSNVIDEGIILWFPGPSSYTGEDMAELHVHGSRAIISALQNTILDTKKCRIAETIVRCQNEYLSRDTSTHDRQSFHTKGQLCFSKVIMVMEMMIAFLQCM